MRSECELMMIDHWHDLSAASTTLFCANFVRVASQNLIISRWQLLAHLGV
jgi:hypothetical protein